MDKLSRKASKHKIDDRGRNMCVVNYVLRSHV